MPHIYPLSFPHFIHPQRLEMDRFIPGSRVIGAPFPHTHKHTEVNSGDSRGDTTHALKTAHVRKIVSNYKVNVVLLI